MSYLTGIVVAGLTGLLGRLGRFDRDRAFYPTILIVVAHYYVLFAAMGATMRTVLLELTVMVVFVSVAVVGFRSSLWFVAVALAGHGVFDLLHDRIISNPGVPVWWPAFCLAFDVLAGVFLAWLLYSARIRTRLADAT